MLSKIRKILALVCCLLITLLLLDFTGTLHGWLGWLAKVQFIPALLAVNGLVLALLIVLTLVFGRLYCSVICPLGVLQDGVSHVSSRRKNRRRFRYTKGKPWLRYGILLLFVVALVAGIGSVASLLDPYAAYGRIATNLFGPVYRSGNNLLAWLSERVGSYAFYSTEVWVKSGVVLGVSAATLLIVGLLSWRNRRTYCNRICPVGTILGSMARFSLFRPVFDEEKCTHCGLCEQNCKALCIDSANLTIDRSRCLTCFNCLYTCKSGAVRYAPRPAARKAALSGEEKKGLSRRSFLALAGTLAATHTLKAQQLKVDGGLADIEDKKVPDRKTPVVPPGAGGAAHLKQHCTACQLCVSVCPNGILRPSNKLSTLMQPELTFERGWCRPECTECSQVCPTDAIREITPADKSALSIGQAIWIKDNCVVNTDSLACTACERHCPTQAITLVAVDSADPRSLKIPAVNKELCIGCGACEYHCPARPFSAIYVEGHARHHSV